MPFDYKKEYKEFYLPPQKPQLLEVPPTNYVAVRGHGDPNAQDGEYQVAIGMLYAVAFTIKMSYKGAHQIPGYFEYVVPPLEGLWWQEGQSRVDYAHKETFSWIAMIRVGIRYPSAGLCDKGGFRMGGAGGCSEKEAGFLCRGISDC